MYEISQVSMRQAMTPAHLLGRANAAVRLAGLIAALAGSLIAGAVADRYGARPVFVTASCVMFAGAAIILATAAGRMRELPSDGGSAAA